MHKSIWVISGIVIVLAILVLFAPFVTGLMIQKEYPKVIAQLSHSPAGSVRLVAYHRGWFSSRAQLQFSVSIPNGLSAQSKSATNAMMINQHIFHGPLAFFRNAKGHYKMRVVRAVIQNTIQSPQTQLRSTTIWTLANQYETGTHANNIVMHTPFGQVSLSGLKAQSNFNAPSFSFKGSAFIKDLRFQQDVKMKGVQRSIPAMHIQNFHFNSNTKKIHDLWYGNTRLSAGNFTLTSTPKYVTQLQQAIFTFHQAQEKNKTNLKTTLSVKSFKNPVAHLSDVEMNLAFQHINSQALNQYAQQTMKAQKTSADALKSQIGALYSLVQLLSKGLVVKSTAQGNTTLGPVQFDAMITVPHEKKHVSIMELMLQTKGHAELSLPYQWASEKLATIYRLSPKVNSHEKALKKMTPKARAAWQIAHWIKMGQFVHQGKRLLMKIQIKKASVYINGKQLSQF